MSKIILFFSEVLNPFSILQYLENLKLVCTFFSCSIVLDIFQETAFNFFASKKDLTFKYLECPLPYLLNMLFLMLRLDQIESACHITNKGNLKLHYISHLILKLSMHLEFTGIKYQNCIDRCNKLFLNFLMKLNEKKNLSLVDFLDNETLHHVEYAFFSINKHSVSKCDCNYPLIGDAKYSVKCPKIGELLLKRNLYFFQVVRPSGFYRNNMYTLKDLVIKNVFHEEEFKRNCELHDSSSKIYFCIDYLFFDKPDQTEIKIIYSKIILLLQTMPELISLIMNYTLQNINLCLPFIIQFGKTNILDTVIDKGSYEFWNKAFDLNLKLSNGYCCICERKFNTHIDVDWNHLSILTIRSLRAKETVKLIIRYADSISTKKIDIR